jgi:hypothetical protein
LTRLFNSPDITDAIRQGVRDGIGHVGSTAANASDAHDTERAGHAD